MKDQSSLLLLIVSPRGERSGSRKLAHEYLQAWKAAHPEAKTVVRDLGATPPPVITEHWIAGAFTPPETHTPEARNAIALSNALVDEVLAASEIVIATPLYNLNIPGALKLWIDQIVRSGRTFVMGPAGAKGLAGGRRVRVLISSSGDFRPGQPAGTLNFAEPYLRAVFGYIGIEDVRFVYAFNQSPHIKEREAILAEAANAARALAAA